MSTPSWNDDTVVATMREVVQDLGRRTALDPSRLRAALNDSLGSQAHAYRAQIDVLVVAAEEGVPGALIADPSSPVRGRLLDRDLQPGVADWAIGVWRESLGLPSAGRGSVPTSLPPAPSSPPGPSGRPGPIWSDPTSLPPGPAPVSMPPTSVPPTSMPRPTAPVPTGRPEDRTEPQTAGATAQGQASRPGVRRGVQVGAAALVIAGLVTGGVALAARAGSGTTAGPPVVSTSATPSRTPTQSAGPGAPVTPSIPSTPTGPTKAKPAAVAKLVVMAHEGGDEHYPPETTVSLVDAVKRGYAAETDVRWTADGTAVLVHDERTESPMNCGRSYEIAKTRYSTLKKKCRSAKNGKGYGLPTFADTAKAIAAVPGGQVFVEIKTDQSKSQVAKFHQTLATNDLLSRAVVTSFLPAELAKMQALDRRKGGHLRFMQFVKDEGTVTAAQAKKAGLWAVAVRYDKVTSGYVRSLHRSGLVVIGWTANERSDWSRLRKAKVDYVLTDKPGGYLKWK